MGFGYLLIGYLVAFLLKMTAQGLHIGFLALFAGYGLMLYGLWHLKRYCGFFVFSEWTLYPLLLTAIYRMLQAFTELFLWKIPLVNATVTTVVDWVEFILYMLFHALLLSAIREIALQVELRSTAMFAVRNSVIVLLYGVVYLVYLLPFAALDTLRPYLNLSAALLNLAWLICNLLLLLSCTKNICAKGDEEITPKRYRWNLLNRIGDRFDATIEGAANRQRGEIEEHLRRRQEKKKKKKK